MSGTYAIGLLEPETRTVRLVYEADNLAEVTEWVRAWEKDSRGLVPITFPPDEFRPVKRSKQRIA